MITLRTSFAASLLFGTMFALGACSGGDDGAATCDECNTPPANACEGDTLYTFSPLGECADGRCIYPPQLTDCPAGCADGACLDVVDLCEGVRCDAPPGSACDGDVATQYASEGECNPDTGSCSYEPITTDCARNGLICVDGACEPVDPCEDVVCDAPPEDECLNPGTVRTWTSEGTCNDEGECEYAPETVNCGDTGQICIEGACVDEPPCFGDDCSVVAAPRCDGTVSVRQINGRCDDELSVCTSDEDRVDCALTGKICDSGLCATDVACRGVICDVPPEDRCEGSRLVRYVDEGFCQAGEGTCEYPREVIACSDMGMTCQDGACVDSSCLGVICAAAPDDSCDGDTLLTYSGLGVCEGGDCTYVPEEIDCTATGQLCERGACVDPLPCDGVTCDETPDAYCVEDVLRVPFGGGVCEDGLCRYGESVVDCTVDGRTCRDGGCRDACFDVTCEEPPAAACDEDTAIGFEPVGSCRPDTGECEYLTVTTNCLTRGEVCIDGECVADPCGEEITCDEPPAGRCDENVAIIPFGAGICTRGSCSFAERRRDCTLDGLTCIDGDCRDACYGVECEEPPVDWCDGDSRVFYPDGGTCNPETGGCRYRASSENCASDGLICLDGECVEDPCDTGDVTCDELPAPTCDGEVEVVPFGEGLCERGACSFAERRTDCTVDGLTCIDGGCRDACYEVACEEPPAPSCEGELLIMWSDEGTCDPDDGSCSYTQTTRDCELDGQLCIDGACVEDPCDTITCDEPPAATCDGDILSEGFGEGTCSRGECTYATIVRDCTVDDLACIDGGCRDDCYGVTCETPPEPTCEGETLTEWSETGICLPELDGECLYEATTTNCTDEGQICLEGACVDDPCDTITCDSPAPAVCDGNFVRAEFGTGTCERGVCTYATRVRDCDDDGLTCIDADCRDACYEVVCEEPPEPTCAEDVVIGYEEVGTCDPADASCSYAVVTTNCFLDDQICVDGACVDDPCDTLVCDTPPDGYCDGNTEVEPFGVGACDRGDCSYAERRLDCESIGQTCIDGACRDACYRVTCDEPPATTCEGDTVLGFLDEGSCAPATGECTYTAVTENCVAAGEICLDGECLVDPCETLTCDEPPASYCDENTEVVPFGIGVCDRGDCSYAERRTPCEDIDSTCLDGACRDACYEVACDAPPADACIGETAVQYGPDSGECLLPEGECNYRATTTNCLADGRACFEGACIADPCGEDACTELPDPVCDGNEVVAALPGGVCTLPDGECIFELARTDCAETGQTCRDGACIDACTGVTCDAPPAPVCDGILLTEFSNPGECNPIDGSCAYEATFTDCGLTDEICVDGACVPDPCFDVVCDTPPGTVCDGDVQVTSLPGGACNPATGLCEYPETRVDCIEVGSFDCVEGACVDRCDSVVCDSPPETDCFENFVRTYTTPGTCDPDVGCQYDFEFEDCSATGEVCRDGACAEPEPCDLISCDRPPSNACDGNVAVAYGAEGTCTDGVCSYAETRTDCADTGAFCLFGACIDEDPCEGLTCDEPPASYCDLREVVSFEFSGTCEPETCIYDEVRTECAPEEVCLLGACVDPCDGLTCDTPPDNFCADSRTYLEYAEIGVCDAAACLYELTEVDCSATGQFCTFDEGCVDADPCADVVCEPIEGDPFCEGNLLFRPTEVVCIAGACNTVVPPLDCGDTGQRCIDGACVDDPCAELVCVGAPDPERDCADDFTARVFTFTGECTEGACQTTFDTTDCEAEVENGFCSEGFCVSGDACFGDCADSAPSCDGDEVVYETDGRCLDGTCTYSEAREDCSIEPLGACVDGACITGTPCEELDCEGAPTPDPVCAGNTSVVFVGAGTCLEESGTYTWDATETNCTDTEQFCVEGICVDEDPCDTLVCDSPPPARCEGDFAVAYVDDSVCLDGACEYPATVTDCFSFGQECFEGECTDDPCADVVCTTPPPQGCDGDQITFYDPAGTCAGGACEYPVILGECEGLDVCVEGTCAPALYRSEPFDIVLSESLAIESGGWFELHNTTDAAIDLRGLRIEVGDEGAGFDLSDTLIIEAGGYAVFASAVAIGIFDADVVLPGDTDLRQFGTDPVTLLAGETQLDRIVPGAAWPGNATTAAQRDPGAMTASSTDADWCDATSEYFDGLNGTPGAANFACAP